GNVIGANLFNIVLVCSTSILIRPFNLAQSNVKMIAGMNSSLLVDLPLMLFVMLILTVPALARGRLPRAVGFILLTLYAGFCVFQFAA
ncbi:MAG: sodium:calcium antiporter, partial [Clostridia bacterium]|nr:sodium:calcium antiporter [Clostridia bacterium]